MTIRPIDGSRAGARAQRPAARQAKKALLLHLGDDDAYNPVADCAKGRRLPAPRAERPDALNAPSSAGRASEKTISSTTAALGRVRSQGVSSTTRQGAPRASTAGCVRKTSCRPRSSSVRTRVVPTTRTRSARSRSRLRIRRFTTIVATRRRACRSARPAFEFRDAAGSFGFALGPIAPGRLSTHALRQAAVRGVRRLPGDFVLLRSNSRE
jgi:hypothetical protein